MCDESDDSEIGESDKLGSESRSAGTFGNGLGGLLCGKVFPLGVTIYDDESCGGDGGPLALPLVNIRKLCILECTSDANILSIVQISSES